ncbi:MAG: MFS transporter [Acidobacteria bacterium]|nr:MFS transporter [Acidobacteriota bacterium]
MTTAAAGRGPLSAGQWRILALLIACSFICLVDRTNLSIGATDIQRDLHLTDYRLGLLLSAFFFTYAAFQLLSIAGWLADRFNVCWVLGAGFLLWSAATALSGAARTFAAFFALRLLLGIGESVAYPAYARILVNYFPEHHRGLANALIDAATKAGPSVGTLLGGLFMLHYGWRPFFIVLGFAGAAWLLPWYRWMPRGQSVATRQDPAAVPSVADILRRRSAWSTALGQFCANYFWYFLITWLPGYLEKERHFPKDKMAFFGSFSFFLIGIVSVTSGWLADRWIRRGATPTLVRKTFAGTGLALSTIILPVVLARDERTAMALLFAACVAFGIYTPTIFAMTQTLAGPLAAGKWTGLQNGFANLAGVAAPVLTGWIVQVTGQFYLAFLLAAAIALAGAAFLTLGVGRIEQVAFPVRATD